MPTDRELIERIHCGDDEAVAELYGRYAPLVWRFLAARLRGDVHRAQDVHSETFLAAMQALRGGKSPRSVAAWLTGIARNKVADCLRQQSRSQESRQEFADQSAQGHFENAEAVADVLDSLPDDERLVLEWKYLDRLTVREIAARLGRTEKAVESLLFRARKAFRDEYKPCVKEP